MPKGLPHAKLSKIAPTQEELEKAREHLRSLNPAQVNSKKTSMRTFLAKNVDNDAAGTTNKQDLLEKFHIHVMRTKTTEKNGVRRRV